MSDDIFDAIIVGAGLAGSVAALVLAREAGLECLVIERGTLPDAKNVTGGRLLCPQTGTRLFQALQHQRR